jgi:hypothetical protein
MLSIASFLDFIHLISERQSTAFSGVASSTPVFKLGVAIQLDLTELQITGCWWKVHTIFYTWPLSTRALNLIRSTVSDEE